MRVCGIVYGKGLGGLKAFFRGKEYDLCLAFLSCCHCLANTQQSPLVSSLWGFGQPSGYLRLKRWNVHPVLSCVPQCLTLIPDAPVLPATYLRMERGRLSQVKKARCLEPLPGQTPLRAQILCNPVALWAAQGWEVTWNAPDIEQPCTLSSIQVNWNLVLHVS